MSTESELKYAKHIELDGEDYTIFDIKKAASDCDFDLEKLPYSLRVLFENVVRNGNGDEKELERRIKDSNATDLIFNLIIIFFSIFNWC